MMIQDVMSPAFALAGPDLSLRAAAQQLLAAAVEALIVVAGGRVHGCIGLEEVLALPGSRAEERDGVRPEQADRPTAPWGALCLRDRLPADIYLVSGEAPLMAAVALMTQARLHCLAVVVDGHPAGIVSWTHLVRGVLEAPISRRSPAWRRI